MTSELAANDSTPPAPAAHAVDVRHEPALARYTIWVNGSMAGLLDYDATGHEIRFTHTEVDPAKRHSGLAGILVEQALDDVRVRTTVPVVAECPYVATWIDKHAEYQDLLTRGR